LNLRPPGYETCVARRCNGVCRMVRPRRSAEMGSDPVRQAKVWPKNSSLMRESRPDLQLVIRFDHVVVRVRPTVGDILFRNEQPCPAVVPCRASLCTLVYNGRSYLGVCPDPPGVGLEAKGHEPAVGAQKVRAEDVLVCVHSSVELALAFDRAGRRDLPSEPAGAALLLRRAREVPSAGRTGAARRADAMGQREPSDSYALLSPVSPGRRPASGAESYGVLPYRSATGGDSSRAPVSLGDLRC
jgi:hypothetical protein